VSLDFVAGALFMLGLVLITWWLVGRCGATGPSPVSADDRDRIAWSESIVTTQRPRPPRSSQASAPHDDSQKEPTR